MSRTGMNPARTKHSTYRPARVTVAVLVHIPNLTGFYEHRLEVLKACLDSILQNTNGSYDLLVFDNASCIEVQAYIGGLQDEGLVTFVYRSAVNVGKLAALRLITDAAPGELIAFSDDDVYHYPGWLEAELEVHDNFPNVGVVSGYVTPSMFVEERTQSARAFARSESEAVLTEGDVVPSSMTVSWATSISLDPERELKEQAELDQYLIEYRGVKALAAAHHDQFLSSPMVMDRCLPKTWDGRLMGGMVQLDQEIDRTGYLRLTTSEQHTQNLGNRFVEQDLVLSQGVRVGLPRTNTTLVRRLLKSRPVRFVLLGIYSRLFHLVHPE
ncbi:MAG: glycosyltransferase family A protein, partial [Anaerolineales bacterium]